MDVQTLIEVAQNVLGFISHPAGMFAGAVLALLLSSGIHHNLTALLLILCCVKTVDMVLNPYLLKSPLLFYGGYTLLDLLVVAAIWNRQRITGPQLFGVAFQRFAAEYFLLLIYCISIIVNIPTLLEAMIRGIAPLTHLWVSHFGEKPYYFYDLYRPIKSPLQVIEQALILGLGINALLSTRKCDKDTGEGYKSC